MDDAQRLVEGLAALGYPGFMHFSPGRRVNPAQLLFDSLRMHDLEPRLGEALPWVVWRHSDLDWDWLVREAKLYDVQNRLGFVVGLGRQVAELKEQQATAEALAAVEQRLEPTSSTWRAQFLSTCPSSRIGTNARCANTLQPPSARI